MDSPGNDSGALREALDTLSAFCSSSCPEGFSQGPAHGTLYDKKWKKENTNYNTAH